MQVNHKSLLQRSVTFKCLLHEVLHGFLLVSRASPTSGWVWVLFGGNASDEELSCQTVSGVSLAGAGLSY